MITLSIKCEKNDGYSLVSQNEKCIFGRKRRNKEKILQ